MGAEYNREEKIKDLEQISNKLRDDTLKMYEDKKCSTSDILKSWDKKDKIDDDIKRLKSIDEIEKNFSKNINLEEYKNKDGTFNIYKAKRALNTKGGKGSQKLIKKLHHEGIAIGNEQKKFFSDYGVGEGDLEVRFWDNKEKKDEWEKIEKVGTCKASENDIKKVLFGESSEKWTNPKDYALTHHNCQHYAKEKISELKDINAADSKIS